MMMTLLACLFSQIVFLKQLPVNTQICFQAGLWDELSREKKYQQRSRFVMFVVVFHLKHCDPVLESGGRKQTHVGDESFFYQMERSIKFQL